MDIKVPNLGDGIDSAVVVSILVSPGDSIENDQTILEMETDKAVAPLPSTSAGKIATLNVKEGDSVKEGMVIATLEGGSNSSAPQEDSAPAAAQPTAPTPAAPAPAAAPTQVTAPQSTNYTYVSTSGSPPPSSPYIRKVAQDLGLDLGRIQGTANGGRITLDDVRQYVTFLQSQAFTASAPTPEAAPAPEKKVVKPLPDFSKFGPITTQDVSSLRKKIADNMTDSWNSIPHVTQFDEADITDLMALRKKYNPKYIKKDAKLTVTAVAIKTIVGSLQKFPLFNSSYDYANNKLIQKEYYNIGVAVDTDNGLIVPVIRDVDKKSVLDIALELNEVAEKARERKLTLDDLQGGSFTISNLGGLGVSHFTPIVNSPEVAILGMARGVQKPEYTDKGKLEPRLKLPLCLSYDHRVIDGADGARFIRDCIHQLENIDEKLLKL